MPNLKIVCWNIENLNLSWSRRGSENKLRIPFDQRWLAIREILFDPTHGLLPDVLIILEVDPVRADAETIARSIISGIEDPNPAAGAGPIPGYDSIVFESAPGQRVNESYMVIYRTSLRLTTSQAIPVDGNYRNGWLVQFTTTDGISFGVATIHAPPSGTRSVSLGERLRITHQFFDRLAITLDGLRLDHCVAMGDFNFQSTGPQLGALVPNIEGGGHFHFVGPKHLEGGQTYYTPTSVRQGASILALEPLSQPYDLMWRYRHTQVVHPKMEFNFLNNRFLDIDSILLRLYRLAFFHMSQGILVEVRISTSRHVLTDHEHTEVEHLLTLRKTFRNCHDFINDSEGNFNFFYGNVELNAKRSLTLLYNSFLTFMNEIVAIVDRVARLNTILYYRNIIAEGCNAMIGWRDQMELRLRDIQVPAAPANPPPVVAAAGAAAALPAPLPIPTLFYRHVVSDHFPVSLQLVLPDAGQIGAAGAAAAAAAPPGPAQGGVFSAAAGAAAAAVADPSAIPSQSDDNDEDDVEMTDPNFSGS